MHYTKKIYTCPKQTYLYMKRRLNTQEYLLVTPLSRVLPEKLTGSQLVKKFSEIYGTRRFITAFISARHFCE
jgi:hypothetical protein